MLALQSVRLRPHILGSLARPAGRRYFIQSLSDGFLDLALALPIPPSLPPYSTTIILVTLVTRCALLPISIWGRERTRRVEEVVLPQIVQLKPVVAQRVFEEMKTSGVRGDKKFLQQYHTDRCVQLLTAKRKELFTKYKCSPLPSIIIPPLSQLPIFFGFTIVLGRLSADPMTPFDSEALLTLTSLAHPDTTMVLPVVLGLLSMANIESGNWVMNAAEREQMHKIEEQETKRVAEGGKPGTHPGKTLKTSLAVLSIFRIVIAAMTPGSVTLYWVTSAAFGLVQTWVVEWRDAQRRRRVVRLKHGASTPNTTPRKPS